MKSLIVVVSIAGCFAGCSEREFDTGLLATGGSSNIGETTYVQINPPWTEFNSPEDVLAGGDGFIYVADTYNDRIVMLNAAGARLSVSQSIRRPIALAQDYRRQLIVCAEFDTLLAGHSTPTTFAAVYRLDLVSAGHIISAATPRRVFFEPGDSTRRYTGVAPLYDNTYYLSRFGPKNTNPVDRDGAILFFSKNDQLITPVTQNFAPTGTGLMSIHKITGITTVATGRSVEFVFSQVQYTSIVPLQKVQWIRFATEGQTANFISKFPDANEVDLVVNNKFTYPEDVTLDPSGNLYVVDASTDSLYRFNSQGKELYSFGGTGNGDKQFRQPTGVAFMDKTVYVADRGNNRVVLFKLSTDLR
ncbi:MAG: hypothetical protein A3G43_12645 [Ignavibacteria bacterium RIFCSPLOWO2_12_FULL_56_21]|nr:MAG: hypothetical protein A3G43_12645 [Ignavibacteria bacterium RIFCSPLOWO2_12_FULL_56_21]